LGNKLQADHVAVIRAENDLVDMDLRCTFWHDLQHLEPWFVEICHVQMSKPRLTISKFYEIVAFNTVLSPCNNHVHFNQITLLYEHDLFLSPILGLKD